MLFVFFVVKKYFTIPDPLVFVMKEKMKVKNITRFYVVVLSLILIASVYDAEAQESFGGSIILGRPTDSAITVNVLFDSNQDSAFIEYGTSSGSYGFATPVTNSINNSIPYEVELNSLSPDTRYYYRVNATTGISDERTFHTARARGSEFSFAITTDSHLGTAKH